MATQQALLKVLLKGRRVPFQGFFPRQGWAEHPGPTQFRLSYLPPLTLGPSPAQACVTASEADGLMNKEEALTLTPQLVNIQMSLPDFPGGSAAKNPPISAVGDMG